MSNRRRGLLLLSLASLAAAGCVPREPDEPQLAVAHRLIEEAHARGAPRGLTVFGYASLGNARKPVMGRAPAQKPDVRCPPEVEDDPRHQTCIVAPPLKTPRAAAWILETPPIATMRRLAKQAAGHIVEQEPVDLTRRYRLVIDGGRPGKPPGTVEMPAWLTPHLRAWPAPYVPGRDYLSQPYLVPPGAQLEFAVGVEEPAWYVPAPPVAFEVEARGPDGVVHLYRRVVDPVGRLEDRGWHDERVSLAALAGKSIRFRLKVRSATGAQIGARLPVWGDPTVFAPAAQAERRPSVVLVSLDTLRARSTSAFGYDLPTTPFLDHLADRGTRFPNAFTTFSNTLGAHMSMLTGAHPSRHAKLGGHRQLSEKIETLAARLREAGYTTAAFTEDALLDAAAGFERGFSHYWENKTVEAGAGDAPGTFARGLDWLEDHRDRPVFLFLHTYAVHGPYEPRAPYDTLFRDAKGSGPETRMITELSPLWPALQDDREAILAWLDRSQLAYEQEIRQLDDDVASMVARLDALLVPRETLLVVTADHGEEFGEHGAVSHVQLYDEVLHVPLLLRWPERISSARRSDALVSLVDLPATILDLVGIPHETPDGRSFAPLLRGDVDTPPRTIIRAESPPSKWSQGQWTYVARSITAKCFAAADTALDRCYDLAADPAERHPLAIDAQPAALHLAARMFADGAERVRGKRRASPGSAIDDPHADPERERKLRALGYVE